MAHWRFRLLLAVAILLQSAWHRRVGSGFANAQFTQTFTWSVRNNAPAAQWQPDSASPLREVINFPQHVVVLEYNCAYMIEICRNADAWYATNAGRSFIGLPFAYDFNSGRKGRSAKRRRRVCPTGKNGWKSTTTCPHGNQSPPMRHDGPWFTTLLEGNTKVNGLENERNAQKQITRYSSIRYSCDEFPPATWVQGGKDIFSTATTRCAAMRCGKGAGFVVKAEQDWQATAHGRLRDRLKNLVERYQFTNGIFLSFNPMDDVVFFTLRTVTEPNTGVAAKVYVYQSTTPVGTPSEVVPVSQTKRNMEGFDTHSFVARSPVEEWKKMGNVSEFPILVNDTSDISLLDQADLRLSPIGTTSSAFFSNSTGASGSDGEEDDDESYDDLEEQYAQSFSNSDTKKWKYNSKSKVVARPSSPLNQLSQGLFRRAWRLSVTTMRSAIALPISKASRSSASEPLKSEMSGVPQTPGPAAFRKNESTAELQKARLLVEAAISKSVELNMARYAEPARNPYGQVSTTGSSRKRQIIVTETVPPLLNITDEIAEAAALVSEADAMHLTSNLTARSVGAGSFWMGSIARKGIVPWGGDSSYEIFRNVRDYGAKGDGVTDDTKAIKSALNDGKRCGEKCNGSTTKNAIVYFPPGTYRVSSSIPLPFGTQVIGDANDRPTLVAAEKFVGLGVLSTDEYTGGGVGIDGGDQEWFVNTANFYRQIRNIRIDITATNADLGVAALHYQVAQATSLQDVEIVAKRGTKQRGIFAENGSGGSISDVTFRGGGFGIYGGTQQFTAQRLNFFDCDVGVQVIWDWGWVWKSISMINVGTGFKLLQEGATSTKRNFQRDDGGGVSGNIGSASVTDSSFKNVDTAILIAPPSSELGSGSTGVIIENVKFQGVSKAVADTSGNVLLAPSATVRHWALGPVYSATGERTFSRGGSFEGFKRQPALLDSAGNYFERPKPQYAEKSVSDFVHARDFGALGDGIHDDTQALQSAILGSVGKVLFIDAGSYILTGTVMIPPGAKIVGETWSQLVAKGSFFEDASKPQPMIKVGNEGDVGDVEMQDIIFTNIGATAGLVLVEWNINADKAGSAGLWDCHVRIGGATGTKLTPAECPPVTSGVNSGCSAASLMMHITSNASGYFENMWLWGADHMIDDPDLGDAGNDMVQTSVYVARGLLIESKAPTWLYATASEHAVFYQYNFHEALNIYAGMIQTESPYYQPTPKPPAPFASVVGAFKGDPTYDCNASADFDGCDASWAVIMQRSGNIFIAGAGLYSWFSTYAQDCIDSQSCQKALLLLEENHSNVRFQNLVTIGAKYMAVQDGQGILARDNLNVRSHPSWSQISVLDVSSGKSSGDLVWISPELWDMDEPRFTCSPPCTVVLPAWTKASTVIDVPIMTVTQGSWTSQITKAPLTVSHWMFEIVTLQKELHARGDAAVPTETSFWPKPARRSHWPLAQYRAPDGNLHLAAPTAAFPQPPGGPGPVASPPQLGHWPKRAVVAKYGITNNPLAQACPLFMPDRIQACLASSWLFPDTSDSVNDPYDESDEDDDVECPAAPTTTTDVSPPPEPTATPRRSFGHPTKNVVSCRKKGRSTSHKRIDEAIAMFCKNVQGIAAFDRPGFEFSDQKDSHASNEVGGTRIMMKLEVLDGCYWPYNADQCARYLRVPTDSCDCGGKNGKHGGTVENDCLKWDMNVTKYWEW